MSEIRPPDPKMRRMVQNKERLLAASNNNASTNSK